MSNIALAAPPADGAALTNAFLTGWRDTIHSYFNNGASLQTGQMADRYATCYLPFQFQANIGAATIDLEYTLEAGVELRPVRLVLKAAAWVAGALTLNVMDDGVSILSAGALSINSAVAVATEGFTGNVAGGSVLRLRFIGDATPWNGTNIHGWLKFKELLRA